MHYLTVESKICTEDFKHLSLWRLDKVHQTGDYRINYNMQFIHFKGELLLLPSTML